MRTQFTYTPQSIATFKQQLLRWGQQFTDVVWLDSNNYNQLYATYDAVFAADAFTSLKTDYTNAFNDLKEYQTVTKDWLFGYLTYDLKNDVEAITSNNFDGLHFPELYFFQPKRLFLIKDDTVTVCYLNMIDDELEDDIKAIEAIDYSDDTPKTNTVKIKLRITKDEYIKKVEAMLAHIKRGDIYEANFCQEFFAEKTTLDPLHTYQNLNAISKPPFACFLKCDDKFLLSASPERYIKKQGNKIISQPIKGTAKRGRNEEKDNQLKDELAKNSKERSENVMIVDLVRNDLSKTATKGSVQVEELCKVYSFKQVHQMISTVVSTIDDSVNPVDVIKTTYPMGSMTGAPKLSAMQIIEDLEETKRGLYSGSVGYFTPDGDFDFNVIIRSILYNKTLEYVSYSVGGAITAKSSPKKEYEECLIKAKAMRYVLEN